MSDKNIYKEAHRLLARIPLFPPKSVLEYDLLRAVEIFPASDPQDLFQPIGTGINKAFFRRLKETAAPWEELMKLVARENHHNKQKSISLNSHFNLTVALDLASVVGAGGIDWNREQSFALKYQDIESISSIEAGIEEYLTKYLQRFVEGDPSVGHYVKRRPTIWSGQIEFVLGFVVRSMEGTCQMLKEGSAALSSEMKVAEAGGLSAGYSSSEKDDDSGFGTIGVSLFVFHLVKTHQVEPLSVNESFVVDNIFDPKFKRLAGSKVLQAIRKKRAGVSPGGVPIDAYVAATTETTNPRTYQEWEQQRHATVEGSAFLRGRSIYSGDISEDHSCELTVEPVSDQDNSKPEPLYEENRVGEDTKLSSPFRGSLKVLYKLSLSKLKGLYEKVQSGEAPTFGEWKVLAIEPIFKFDFRGHLPIHYWPKSDDEDTTDVPGKVARVFENFTVYCPVEGYELNEKVLSAYDYEDWRVRESILYVDGSNQELLDKLIADGFHELDPDEANLREVEYLQLEEGSFVVMGRHELIRTCDDRIDEASGEPAIDGIFRRKTAIAADRCLISSEAGLGSGEVPAATRTDQSDSFSPARKKLVPKPDY